VTNYYASNLKWTAESASLNRNFNWENFIIA